MYNKIYEFCKVRNEGNIFSNTDEPTPRVKYLMRLLEQEGIEYELDSFIVNSYKEDEELHCYNIIMKGSSNKMVVAHHDIVNPNIDNANDNSASVINAIMVKKLLPNINAVLLDGEEFGGIGSKRAAEKINDGYFGNIEWVLNLELTGRGGKYFFIGDYPGKLTNHIKSLFDCPTYQTPFNDSVIFRRYGIDSVVINPLPILEDSQKIIKSMPEYFRRRRSGVKWSENIYLDDSILWNCHTAKDSLSTIDVNDMKEFVEEVLVKILK